MCDPITAIAVAGTAASIAQQQGQASDQRAYDRYMQREGTKSAHAAAIAEFQTLQTRENEERAAHAQAVSDITRQVRAAQASATTAIGETGQGGRTAEILIADFERHEGEALQASRGNLAATQDQLRREALAVRARERERIMSLVPPPRSGPLDSPIGIVASGLGIASAGANAYISQPKNQV